MSLYLNGKQGCKIYFEGKEMCVGYMDGKKVFGCRAFSTVSDNSANLLNNSYTFKETDLTLNYTTDAPYTYDKVYIETLTGVDKLNLLGSAVAAGDSFEAINSSSMKFDLSDNYASYSGVLYDFGESIDGIVSRYGALGYKLTNNINGKLTFSKPDDINDVVVVSGTAVDNSELCFNFKVLDNSAQRLFTNVAEFCLIPTGDINVKPIYTNTPPVIGDNTITVNYNETRTLTQAYFVENTNPVYFDKENDIPYELKILSLPQYGEVQLEGVPVVKDQIISFDDINLLKLKYVADSTRVDINNTKFSFAVSDLGSKTFSS